MLSKYCKKIADKYEIKVGDVKKLISNLGNKTNYVVHYRNLQLDLSSGMKLTKIHRVLKFKQSDWTKKYIDFNTGKIINAANDFEKDFFKLMINSVYEKTMENLRKRINVRLANNEKDFSKYTSRPTYITHKIFGKYYAAIHEIKPVLRPVNKTGFYEELFKWKDLFGFSNYSKDSKFFNETNEKVIGKIKDQFVGVIITEFVGLKSEMYSIKNDDKEHKTAKGVSIATQFNKFKNVLFNKKIIRHKMKRIQSKKHKLGTYEVDKISLSCFDEKRYVLDGIYTLSYFHKNSFTSCNN